MLFVIILLVFFCCRSIIYFFEYFFVLFFQELIFLVEELSFIEFVEVDEVEMLVLVEEFMEIVIVLFIKKKGEII